MADDSSPPPYVRWEYAPPPRHRNGLASVSLELKTSDGSPLKDAFWYYKATPLESLRRVNYKSKPSVVTGFFKEGENFLQISTGQYIFVEAMGSAVINGSRHYAQTVFLMYGQALDPKPIRSRGVEPHWPSFNFVGSGDIYWPQTGNAFTLTPKGDIPLGEVSAWSTNGRAMGEYIQTEKGRGFVPATDKELNDLGSAASKPIFFLASEPDGGNVSFTIYVHRNRYAGENINLGLIVLFSSFIGTSLILAFVFWKRRAFRHAAQEI
jgi:hypothetical protein